MPNETILLSKETRTGIGHGVCSMCKESKVQHLTSIAFEIKEVNDRLFWVNFCEGCKKDFVKIV